MTENQNKVIELVKQTKPLIFQEMTHEKVTEKGAADYVTNVDSGAEPEAMGLQRRYNHSKRSRRHHLWLEK